jgi:hypothetical protein
MVRRNLVGGAAMVRVAGRAGLFLKMAMIETASGGPQPPVLA